MIRVAVIDDEPLARSGVIARLASCSDIEVIAEYGDGTAALAGIIATPPDLLFVDIQMPGLSGLDVLAALPSQVRPMAILLTAFDEFALTAFTLNVVDYLLKPIDDDRFFEAIERARKALPYRRIDHGVPLSSPPEALVANEDYVETFTVRIGSRIVFVHVADVEWIEADGDYAALHCGTNRYLIRESLTRLARRLDPSQFVRAHRSTIVRISLVSELRTLSNRDALLRLQNGTPIRASRTYIESLIDALQTVRGCLIS